MRFGSVVGSLLVCAAISLAIADDAISSDGCKGQMINPISEPAYRNQYPIMVGGVTIARDPETPWRSIAQPACACTNGGQTTIGLTSGMFEMNRIVETVKKPYCFPSLGMGLNSGSLPGALAGGTTSSAEGGDNDSSTHFAHAHEYFFNPYEIAGMFLDFPCLETKGGGLDVGYLTEPDPRWNDDLFAMLLSPESLPMANPVTAIPLELACSADAVSATAFNYPLNQLWWCAGSWGKLYPLSGTVSESNPTTANALLVARHLFSMARAGALVDPGLDPCTVRRTPFLVKDNYKFQPIRPAVVKTGVPIGKWDALWGANLNPAWGTAKGSADNYAWIIYRRKLCCLGYSFGGS